MDANPSFVTIEENAGPGEAAPKPTSAVKPAAVAVTDFIVSPRISSGVGSAFSTGC